jgi:hypothetical protein
MILDIDKTTGGGVNQDNANILCRNCVAVTGKVILSSNLSIVDIVKPDLAFYPNNPFPSPTRVVWDKTSGSAGTAGTYSWTPALHCEGGEPTLAVAAAAGLVTIQTSGDKKLVTYQGFYALSSKSGGSGNAYIGPTPLDNFPTPSNTANVHHAVAIGKYLGVTFTTGETQLVAFLPQNDTRIVLAEGGLPAATGNNNFLLCSQLGSGFSMMFSGSYVAD